jgi:hypothetical protein
VPDRFRAWLHAAQAEVYAASGDSSACRRAFDIAISKLPPGPEPIDPDMPYIVLNEAHLARWRGNSLARLGDPAALDDVYRALNGGGTVSTRAEAGLRCDLAQALLLRGEREEARKQATEARRLARRAGSVRQRQRIDRLVLVG